jgi:lipoprotein-anchoring transpeptidase ErfK/SrfK
MPDSLAPPRRPVRRPGAPPKRTVRNPGVDAGASKGAAEPSWTPNGSIRDERPQHTDETPGWHEPPLPNGAKRTYLTGGGSAVVAVAFLVFVAILLAYFSSATSWAPW